MPIPWLLWTEMTGIFIGLPLLLCGNLIPGGKISTLLSVSIICLVLLIRDGAFDRCRFGLSGLPSWRTIVTRFVLIAGGLALYTFFVEPDRFLTLLRHDPGRWALVISGYTVFSVLPQEIIYRAFFFHRYGRLFSGETASVVTNAALFAFAHILFKNTVAVIGTFVAGLLWATTYLRSRSLLAVSVEHALYGDLVFTLGIGYYFYSPNF